MIPQAKVNQFQITPYPLEDYDDLVKQGVFADGEVKRSSYESAVKRYEHATDFTLEHITYDSDGLNVTGLVALPAQAKPHPLLIFNRGGSGNYGSLTIHSFMWLLSPFVRDHGFALMASNYRGNRGSEGREEFGGSDVNDILNLIDLGKQQPWWDGKNIFMLGWSRGATMTCLAMKHGAQVNAAVFMAGMSDMALAERANGDVMERVFTRWLPDWPAGKDEAFKSRSPIMWAEKISAPLLILHGDADDKTTPEQGRKLAERLTELQKPHAYIEYARADHSLSQVRGQAIQDMAAWFEKYRE